MSTQIHPMPLQFILDGLPNAEPAEGKAAKQRKLDHHIEELILEFPWLKELDGKEGFSDVGLKEAAGLGGFTGKKLPEPAEMDDELLFGAVNQLEKAKAHLAAAPGARHNDFGTKIRGGPSQLLKTGEMVHAAQAVARNPAAISFCARRGVNQTFKSTFSKGIAAGEVLVRGWARKMQHFFNLEFMEPEGEALVFVKKHHDDYQESDEFLELAENTDLPHVKARIAQIRALFQ